MVGHERDGRAWKAEWVALPEVCLLPVSRSQMALRLLSGLVVDADGDAGQPRAVTVTSWRPNGCSPG